MSKFITFIVMLAGLFTFSLLVLDHPWQNALLYTAIVAAAFVLIDRLGSKTKQHAEKEIEEMNSVKQEVEAKRRTDR